MKTDYDVIIVGAGPAGASCAKHLVDNGVKTLIIEKCKLPRYKCCSGLLNERAVQYIEKNFGEIPENIICSNKIIKFKFSKIGKTFLEDENTIMLNIYRNLFDHWLIKQANPNVIDSCSFIKHEVNDNLIKVFCKKNKEQFILTCNYLIGADGGNSRIKKMIDNRFTNHKLIFALQLIYQGKSTIDKNFLYYLTGKKFSQEFAWFNIKDNLIYIGTSFFLDNKNNQFLSNIKKILIEDFQVLDLVEIRREGCFYDTRKNKEKFFFGDKNVLLAGEASGLITVYGEGISSALISGETVAQTILENNGKHDIIDVYNEKILDEKEYIMNTWKYI